MTPHEREAQQLLTTSITRFINSPPERRPRRGWFGSTRKIREWVKDSISTDIGECKFLTGFILSIIVDIAVHYIIKWIIRVYTEYEYGSTDIVQDYMNEVKDLLNENSCIVSQ